MEQYILFGYITVWGFIGIVNAVLAMVNVMFHIGILRYIWHTKHHITTALKREIMLEIGLLVVTIIMGIGAFADGPDRIMQHIALICRIGLLILSPLILWSLIKAFKEVTKLK